MKKLENQQQANVKIILQDVYQTMILIKNHYTIIAFDLSGQKELDADPKAIQQIELCD